MRTPTLVPRAAALLVLALVPCGCSIKRLAVNSLADSLADGADVFATDDDPELVRDALPFALKALEALLASSPENEKLLLACCRGFTQYAYAFVQLDADRMEAAELSDWDAVQRERDRARRLYLRARDYGLRGLELRSAGIGAALRASPDEAVEQLASKDVALAYWTASAWGAAIGQALDRPELVADIDAVRALMHRALELDEDWEDGAIHEALVVVESFPEAMGGSPERAREHFRRAVELSGGRVSSPYVTLAENLSLKAQDRAEFESLLNRALEVDPDALPEKRLANTLSRERALFLLSQADDLFL